MWQGLLDRESSLPLCCLLATHEEVSDAPLHAPSIALAVAIGLSALMSAGTNWGP
jgi:hypothetical protein